MTSCFDQRYVTKPLTLLYRQKYPLKLGWNCLSGTGQSIKMTIIHWQVTLESYRKFQNEFEATPRNILLFFIKVYIPVFIRCR